MSDLVILGTDTDVGKTTFALLWLSLFADKYEYWKPVETGPSDSETIKRLVPNAVVHPPLKHYDEPVAPPLAAHRMGEAVPSAAEIVAARPSPTTGRRLLIESFGGPFSPLNDIELQVDLLSRFEAEFLLVSSSKLGAVGRTLQCLSALRTRSIAPLAVYLLGPLDKYAENSIFNFGPAILRMSVEAPDSWSIDDVVRCAQAQASKLKDYESVSAVQPQPGILQFMLDDPWPDTLERDRRTLWHPYTSLRDPDPPLVCVDAQDEFLVLENGRRIVDGISSWWTILHGHNFPPLRRALREAQLDHVHFAGVTHLPGIELAELLLNSLPSWPKVGRVFYSDNGSTAVEVALKMAYQYWCLQGEPQRTLFIGFEHGYHGDTFGAMAVGRDPVFFGPFEPLLFKAQIIPLSPERLDDVLCQNKEKVAAIIIEPLLQAAGGMRVHAPELLSELCRVAKDHGVLTIADEVMTGGGRLGMLWPHMTATPLPDIVCAAKTLTGGLMPLAATIAAPHIVQAWETDDRTKTFFHGHSYTGHPLACAVAVANWRILLSPSFLEPVRRIEKFWQKELDVLIGHSHVRDIRILGSMAAVRLDVPGGYLADVGRLLKHKCLEKGVLLRPLGNVLYALPPLCTSEASLGQIRDAMVHAVNAVS